MDLVVRNVQLATAPPGALVDIGVVAGRIAASGPGLPADAPSYDAGGRLGCGGLIETHIHLDKARLNDVVPPERGRAINPVAHVAPYKPAMTVESVRARAERALVECLLHGTTRMRTHVEVDPGIGLRGFDAVQSLAQDYAWAIDIDLCVFPQEGLTNRPGTDELLVAALRRGAGTIGGAPRYDSDGPAQIRRIFALAREYGVDVDVDAPRCRARSSRLQFHDPHFAHRRRDQRPLSLAHRNYSEADESGRIRMGHWLLHQSHASGRVGTVFARGKDSDGGR